MDREVGTDAEYAEGQKVMHVEEAVQQCMYTTAVKKKKNENEVELKQNSGKGG